jgi:hypothetical protein
VIVAADQNFPACLPARTAGKECIRIIRCEDGSLQDLTHALADAIGRAKLPKHSVVLLGSLSHLSNTGTEHYIEDWVRSRWWLRDRLGEDICVLPLAPIWCEGLYSRSVIRSTIETLTWFTSLNATETVLMKDTFGLILGKYLTVARGGWVPDRLCFRLPVGLDTRATVAMVSDGWGSWPDSVPAMSKAAEIEIIYSIMAKLEEAFEPNLDLDPCVARSMEEIQDQRAADTAEKWVVVIGSSHAANLSRALESGGTKTEYMTSRGWKLSAENVRAAADRLSDLDSAPDLIVIQALDNNSFFAASEDGSLSLPKKGQDGHYHVLGDLRVASRDQVASILKTVRPMLEVRPEAKKVLVLPVPRYAFPELKCCDEAGHITNAGVGLAAEIKSGLSNVKKAVRSFLFKERIQNVKILDPYVALSNLDRSSFADPVHLVQDGYEAMAKVVVDLLAGFEEGDKTTDPPSSDVSNSKRIRTVSMGTGSGSGARGRGSLSHPPRGRGSYQFRGGRAWRGRAIGKARGSL